MRSQAFAVLPVLLGLTSACSKPILSSGAAADPVPTAAESDTHVSIDTPRTDATPVLVELFSSEGCSSCPPAERVLGDLLDHPPRGTRVLPIEFHVDYWDYIGHVDRFASAAFTQRQKAYAQRLGASSTYTPQAVVDGRAELVGSRAAALALAIEEAAKRPHLRVELTRTESNRCHVAIGATSAARDHVAVMLAEVVRRPATKVERGENAGTTIQHSWVATRLVDLGEAGTNGEVTSGPLTSGRGHEAVAFAVRITDGAILGGDSISMD